jgi:sulfite reductase (NADPH) flavoprotein alpha-component
VTSDVSRLMWAAMACLMWLGLTGLVIWRVRRAARLAGLKAQAMAEAAGEDAVLVVYASQTGFAEELAWMTARALTEGGVGAQILSMTDLASKSLTSANRLLLIASTTGEGDAPDSAGRFVRQILPQSLDLSHLSYGLLALGDRTYDQYCRFGHAVADWLDGQGASSLFDRIEVDNGVPFATGSIS